MLYYQDKLGGRVIGRITVCGYDMDTTLAIEDLQGRFGVAVHRAEPHRVDDIYKPALGAVDLTYERA
jgi:hypothetical protein